MASLNSKISLNNITLDANCVFTKVPNFQGQRDASLQALTHSCLPLPFFLIQVIVFYKEDWASLIETFHIPPHTLRSLPYSRARFTPPGAKYLILDDFHFRIDPQIINYNGLSFHTSMGLSELGRAAARRPLGRPLGLGARPRLGGRWAGRQASVHGHGPAAAGSTARPWCTATTWRPGQGRADPGPRCRHPATQAQPPRLQQLNNHNRTVPTKASSGSTTIC